MKSLNLTVDVSKLELSEEDKKRTPEDISAKVIENIILVYAQQKRGLDARERKQFYGIKQTLDNAIKNNISVVELDDTDGGFIKTCFREARTMPNDLMKQIEQNIENMAFHK